MRQDEDETLPERPPRVLAVAGSARRVNGCPGLDSKARACAHRMLGRLPPGWQVDSEGIGDEHGRPKIQGCNGLLWRHAETGAGRPYAGDRAGDLPREGAAALAAFDGWFDAFVARVAAKGPVPGTDEAARSARPTTL